MVNFGTRAVIFIKRNTEAPESIFVERMVFVDNVLRVDSLFFRPNGNSRPVFIRAANPHDILAAQTQITHIYVSGQIGTGKMTEVQRTVGVGQSGGNELFRHTIFFLFCREDTFFGKTRTGVSWFPINGIRVDFFDNQTKT